MADYDPDRDLDMEVLAAVSGPADGGGGGDGGDSDSSDEFDDEDDVAGEFDADDDDDDVNDDDGDDDEDDDDDDDDGDDDYGDKSHSSRKHPDDPTMEEDDEEEVDDDDDDDDYDVKGKKKKPALKAKGNPSKGLSRSLKFIHSNPNAKPKAGKSASSAKSRRKVQKRRNSKSKDAGDDDAEKEEVFQYKFDERGYGDAEDVEKVLAMNEIERETLLAERIEERQKQEHIWKMTRQMHAKGIAKDGARVSSRTKSSKKDYALEALHEEKVAKKVSAQKRALEESDDDSAADDSEKTKRIRREDRISKEKVHADEDSEQEESQEEHDLEYKDLVVPAAGTGKSGYSSDVSPTHLFLPRDKLVDLVSEPYFARAVTGLFVRFRKGYTESQAGYVCCRIKSVSKLDKIYKVSSRTSSRPKRTNMFLNLAIGDQIQANTSIELCSNSVPTVREFEVYRNRLAEQGKGLMSRTEVTTLRSHAVQMTTSRKPVIATEEELKAHHSNQEILYPETVNWTKRKAELSLDLTNWKQLHQVAGQSEKQEEKDRAQEKIDELEKRLVDIESRKGSTQSSHSSRSLEVFQSVARKNVALNSVNERLAASRRALETTGGGVNPFARFDTTGMSYFSIKSKGSSVRNGKPDLSMDGITADGDAGGGVPSSVIDGKNMAKPLASRPLRGGPEDWKLTLRTRINKSVSVRRPISQHPLNPVYGIAFEGLDDFERTPEELSKLYPMGPALPPSVDAVYAGQVSLISDSSAIVGGKAISIEEYNRLRTE